MSSTSEPTPETPAVCERHEVLVGAEAEGERLDRFLARELAPLTRSRVKALIEDGRARLLGGEPLREPAHKVRAGERYLLEVPPAAPPEPRAEAIPLAIVHEDRDLIVIDKPAGLVVHPAPGTPAGTLVNALIAHCGPELTGIGGVGRPGIVHRLDKGTSGLLVAAKTEAAHQALVRAFSAREIERRYLAFVWGAPVPTGGEIEGPIGRSPRNRKLMAVVRGGKPALTRYRMLERFLGGAVSLVECRLATGRTHQIRVHLAHRGHPLLGDPLYGGRPGRRLAALPEPLRRAVEALDRQALHAATLGFEHPRSGETLRFESPLPADLERLRALLARASPARQA